LKGIIKKIGAIIALKKEGGQKEMAKIICPNCHGKKRREAISVECHPEAKMWGIIQCTACGHELQITMDGGYIQKLDISMPGVQSDKLTSLVPSSIKEDIQEAERSNYSQCYKACVAMCRRALQLSLIDKGIEDKPLGKMLRDALTESLLTQNTYNLATSIKGYGDIGVHRTEELEPKEVEIAIYMAVKMLNELFP
jgi:hypothetical protein